MLSCNSASLSTLHCCGPMHRLFFALSIENHHLPPSSFPTAAVTLRYPWSDLSYFFSGTRAAFFSFGNSSVALGLGTPSINISMGSRYLLERTKTRYRGFSSFSKTWDQSSHSRTGSVFC